MAKKWLRVASGEVLEVRKTRTGKDVPSGYVKVLLRADGGNYWQLWRITDYVRAVVLSASAD